jgi:serine/threonine protein kinase
MLPEPPPPPEPPNLIQQLREQLTQRNMLFPKHHVQLSRIIGEGESGLVYRGYINSGQPVAIKVGKILASENDKEKLLREVSIMLPLNHPNVMSLIGLCFDGEVPLVIMPYMSDGSVLDYVQENRENLFFTDHPLDENVFAAQRKCLDMCHQIAKGMSYLAMQMFVHCDLAARNCMIDGLANGVIKVADFGLAEDMYGTNYYRRGRSEGGERVPIRWMAPESIEMNIYNESTDVWSYGVTCWEVLTCGGVPYAGVPAMTLLTELRSGHRLERPTNLVCSDGIWQVMERCWLGDHRQRPKFSDLVNQLFDLLDADTAYLRL